jgi:hypothetical protein
MHIDFQTGYDREKCEYYTGRSEKLGEAATLERIKNALIGKNVEMEGVKLNGGNFLVKNIREV